MPQHFLLGPQWLLPAVLAVLTVTMLVVDPGRIDERSVQARYSRIAIVIALIAGSGWAAAALTRDLIYGKTAITNSGPALLRAGALVWIGLVISFAFLYWELDAGDRASGPIASGPTPIWRSLRISALRCVRPVGGPSSLTMSISG